MWVERKDGSIVNMDWVDAIEVFDKSGDEDIHDSSYNVRHMAFEIRAYEKGSEGWFEFGEFETAEEAEQELRKIKLELNSKQ